MNQPAPGHNPYASNPYASNSYPPNGYAPAGYAPVHPGTSPAAHPVRGTATAALWCSVFGFLCFPLLGSVLGIVLARSATRNGYPGGRAAAARVLGWIGLVMLALGAVWQGLSAVFG